MTNEDFIKGNLTERDIAAILSFGDKPSSYVVEKAKKVFSFWASFGFTKNSNCGKRESFSIWNFIVWHNPQTQKKERIGREGSIPEQVWLSMPYDEKHWDNAEEEYNKKWL